MSETSPLERDMIAQPQLWRLTLLVGARRLDVALLPPVETEPLLYRSILLDPEAESHTRAVEDAIYANPLLLSDFRSVTCLVDTPQALAVPAEVEPADHEMLLNRAFALDESDPIAAPTGDPAATMVMAMDPELRGFLGRTFYNIRFEHHLAPLCRHLTAGHSGGAAIYAFCRQGAIDLVALGDDARLLTANTFECTADSDAAYYILATAEILGLTDGLTAILGGDAARSAEIESLLRRASGADVRPFELPPLRFKIPAQGAEIPLQLLITSDNANNPR